MKQPNLKNKSGLTLDNPRLIGAEAPFFTQFCFYFFVLLLGISAAYGCFYTAFPIPVSWRVLVPWLVGFTAVFTALFIRMQSKGRGGIIVLALSISMISIVFVLKDGPDIVKSSLGQGFIRTVNYIITAYAQKANYNFITLPVEPAGPAEIAAVCTAPAVFVLFLLTFLMAWQLIGRRNIWGCFLLTAPFLGVSLAFTIIPHYAAVAALLLFWTFLLLNASALHRRKGLVRKGNVFYDDGNTVVHPATFIWLPLIAACLLLVSSLFPMQGFQRSEVVEDLRTGLTSPSSIAGLLRSGGLAGTGNRVNLQFAGSLTYTGETVLRVQSSSRNTEYLKGYVGSVYTGQSWEPLPDEAYRELKELLGERKVQNFPYLMNSLFRFSGDRGVYPYELAVQNVGGNPRNIYMPYGLISGPEDLGDLEFVHDGYLKSGNSLFGTPEYRTVAVTLPWDYLFTTFYSRLAGYFTQGYGLRGGSLGRLGLDMNFQRDFDNSIRIMDEWIIPEPLVNALTEEQASFAQAAQAYNRFVYTHYTQLPEELKGKLDQYRQEHGLDIGNYPWPYSLAYAVINQVQSENSYTLAPGLLPAGRDFVEYFLFENHQGYCRHFASAAVALIRSAGIPARYVEGYTVSSDDLPGDDGWINIPDSRAHAWAEIYLSGLGWVPVEATPGVQNGIIDHQAAEGTAADETATQPGAEEIPDEEEDVPDSAQEPGAEEQGEKADSTSSMPTETDGRDTTPGELHPIIRTLRVGFSILALIVLPVAALLMNRKLRIASRSQRFQQTDRNQAAIAIYKYIEQLLTHVKAAPNFPGKIPEDLYDLVLKARFSRHMLTEQELGKLLGYREMLADHVRSEASLFRRFLLKYIYVLV